jgi:hypothetical protein
MVSQKTDKNQLDLLKELVDDEKISVPVPPEESVADKALREIFEKLAVAKQNKKRKEEGKWVDTSLKKIRSQIEAEQSNISKEAKDDDEAFKPGDEYYGRFNKFRKSK